MKVVVVPYNPDWPRQYEAEARHVRAALGANVVAVHHIGSTAVLGIHAKPVIDLLVAVHSLPLVDECSEHMVSLGYEAMGELGISGRRYFRKEIEGVRTHHVHVFLESSPQVERHLAFRDYLNTHPEAAQAYSDLKQQLAAQFPEDIHGYMDGKDGFIKAIDTRAAATKQRQ